jgi:precorrin-6x reductase
MCDVVLFGGTTEGRLLAEFLSARKILSLVCVATEYGSALLHCEPPVTVRAGKLDREAMGALLAKERPRLTMDATHPYAAEVSENLRAVCGQAGLRYVRILRETAECDGCRHFGDMASLVEWLDGTQGIIFAATGAKEAKALTHLADFASRIWLRMLPSPEMIAACVEMGYPAGRLICMQGPFSRELNAAMFRETGAAVLVTKESGKTGGFEEKLAAAGDCGMITAILSRPPEPGGVSLGEAKSLIGEVLGETG